MYAVYISYIWVCKESCSMKKWNTFERLDKSEALHKVDINLSMGKKTLKDWEKIIKI